MVRILNRHGTPTRSDDANVSSETDPEAPIVVESPAPAGLELRLRPSTSPLVTFVERAAGAQDGPVNVRVGRITSAPRGDRFESSGHRPIALESPPFSGGLQTSRDPSPASRDRAFAVEVVEELATVGPLWVFCDAIRLRDRRVVLVMADVLAEEQPDRRTVARWRAAVRASGTRYRGPERVLEALNRELREIGLQAIASCAEHDIDERVATVACAGAEPPWLLRGRLRAVPASVPISVQLGQVRGARFRPSAHHFGDGDTLLLPSVAWSAPLEEALAGGVPADEEVATWLRSHSSRPAVGSVLCLSVS